MATFDRLAIQCLEDLGVIGEAETASAENMALARTRVRQVLEELSATGIYGVQDDDDIPDAAMPGLAMCCLENVAAAFPGAAPPPGKTWETLRHDGERKLQAITAPRPERRLAQFPAFMTRRYHRF